MATYYSFLLMLALLVAHTHLISIICTPSPTVLFLRDATKVIPVILLALGALRITHDTAVGRFLTACALIASAAGDVLLLQQNSDLHFMLGLGAFLIAHLFYIANFSRIRPTLSPVKCLVLSSAAAAMLYILWPYVPLDLQVPVAVYAAVLCIAAERAWETSTVAGIGGLLFVVSDAVLALNEFWWTKDATSFFNTYENQQYVRFVVMVTYYAAQALLNRHVWQHSDKKSASAHSHAGKKSAKAGKSQ